MYKELDRIIELTHAIDKLRKEREGLLGYTDHTGLTKSYLISVKKFIELFPHETPIILWSKLEGKNSNGYKFESSYKGVSFETATLDDYQINVLAGYEQVSRIIRKKRD